MGMIRINTGGSFPQTDRTFSANESGHAVAVDDAIKYLEELKKKAISQDLKLRQDGVAPLDDFRAARERKLFEKLP